jgi:hypothetical protein
MKSGSRALKMSEEFLLAIYATRKGGNYLLIDGNDENLPIVHSLNAMFIMLNPSDVDAYCNA